LQKLGVVSQQEDNMTQPRLPVVSEDTIKSAREGLEYRVVGNSSWMSTMERENPALFAELQRYAKRFSDGSPGVEFAILSSGVIIYGMLSAQLTSDNTFTKSS
jgi:hypothetical protein